MAALNAPFGLAFGLMGRYPWPTIIVCTLVTIVGLLTKHDNIGVTTAMVGSCVLIWLSESGRPRPIDDGVAAGD